MPPQKYHLPIAKGGVAFLKEMRYALRQWQYEWPYG